MIALAVLAAATSPAAAKTQIPATAQYKKAGAGKWVLKIDKATYGVEGKIVFRDGGYRGPGGASVNDFKVRGGYDARQPSFVQNVVVVAADDKTGDPPHTVWKDDDSGKFGFGPGRFDNTNMDGQTNLGPFGWTTPPGTRFMNMKVDRNGNYFVAKKDMQWGFFEAFRDYDTVFNFQPFPLSDAYGFCGSVLTSRPRARERQSGQLVFDMAFSVYVKDGQPSDGTTPAIQVVPGFVMRSYGSYQVDVMSPLNKLQSFRGSTAGINFNPKTGKLDPRFYGRVSPLGAGVVPKGAWVLNDNLPTMRIVAKGTPGAVYHQNSFAGFAFLLRGDAKRTVVDVKGIDYRKRASWTNWPKTKKPLAR